MTSNLLDMCEEETAQENLAMEEVLNKVGYDDQKVLNYSVEQSMAQHQQASAKFDPVSYRIEYADLRKAYGDTWAGYYNHYVRWGKAAGLQGAEHSPNRFSRERADKRKSPEIQSFQGFTVC